jgi:hypothetical protein
MHGSSVSYGSNSLMQAADLHKTFNIMKERGLGEDAVGMAS